MKEKTHRFCTFEFNNGTFIHAAVPAFVNKEDRSFDSMLSHAMHISWNGNENHGRGDLKSFTVGPLMFVPTTP